MLKPSGMRRSFAALAVLMAVSSADPIATEIHRWSDFLQSSAASAEMKSDIGPVVTRADDAMRQGRRWLALNRLSLVWPNLEARAYLASHPKPSDLQADWKRSGRAILASQSVDGIEPAAVRALAEAALSEKSEYYHASLDYGQNTTPDAGFYYLAQARAQQSFVDFARKISQSNGRRAPQIRSLPPDLDSLERELLAAYRPPASIDKHGEFIGASAMLKEARELDAAGLHDGAMVRYLEAVRRTAQITGTTRPRVELEPKLREFATRLEAGSVDHTIAQIFVEAAQSDLESNPQPVVATAVVNEVLPRYFAALEPAAAAPKAPAARATVTLVRWPYT